MGNDGGSIPKRVDMVRTKKKEVKADDELLNQPRGKYCALSKQLFQQPLCIDKLGLIYNYESLLRALLDKQGNTLAPFKHIQKLKDIKKIQFQESKDSVYIIQCPVTKQVYNGSVKFLVNWNCGCVISQKAFQELSKDSQEACFVCQKSQSQLQMVSLNLTTKEQEQMAQQLLAEKESFNNNNNTNNNNSILDKKTNDQIKVNKKIKKNKISQDQIQYNILNRISNNTYQETSVYKSLFHKNYKEQDDQLFNRNVRHGLR